MSDELENTSPPAGGSEIEQPWGTPVNTGYQQVPPPPPTGYAPPPPGYAPPPVYAAVSAGSGLSDSAAGAIAYLTFIPAVIFLLIDPYKQKPFVKFHCIQEIGLTLVGIVLNIILRFLFVIPFLGFMLWGLCWLLLIGIWGVCVLKASQGGSFKLPVIGKFAAEQSGYNV